MNNILTIFKYFIWQAFLLFFVGYKFKFPAALTHTIKSYECMYGMYTYMYLNVC